MSNLKYLSKSKTIRIILLLGLTSLVYLGLSLRNRQAFKQDFAAHRPTVHHGHIYDYAEILQDIEESTGRYLQGIKSDYAIEAVIVGIIHVHRTFRRRPCRKITASSLWPQHFSATGK